MHVHIYKSMIQLFRHKSNDKVVLGIGINDVRTHVRDVNIYKGISINIYISIRYLKPLVCIQNISGKYGTVHSKNHIKLLMNIRKVSLCVLEY